MTELTEIPLPAAPEIEALVLGSILVSDSPSMPLDVILSNLEPPDFHSELNRSIFRLIAAVNAKGQPPSLATVWTESQAQGVKVPNLSISYLVSLSDGIPKLEGFDSYMGILREKAMLRSLIEKTEGITRRAMCGESALTLVAEMQTIGETVKISTGKGTLMQIEDVVNEYGAENLVVPKHLPGIEPPIPWLAERLRFSPKTLTVLAARTSVGKTALALQIMHEAARRRYRCLLASREMDNSEIVIRMIGQQGRVNMHRLRNGVGSREERDGAFSALYDLQELKDYVLLEDTELDSLPSISRALHRLTLERRPAQFLIVDYLQLMTPVGKFGNRAEEVGSLSRGLKQLASKFDIPVLALSQLNRKGDESGREPELSDLRESGSIEQDSNNIIFLHRMGSRDEELQNIRLILAKNRNGPTGRCDIQFTKRYVRFDQEGSGVVAA
jgi:replicative DNA helicase